MIELTDEQRRAVAATGETPPTVAPPPFRVPEGIHRSRAALRRDLPELLSMSDRIYVMRLGRIVRELDAAKTSQQEVLYHASLGEGHPYAETG